MDDRESGLQPLDDAATGCTLAFVPTGRMYQPLSALAVLAGLNSNGFAGVCECYIQPDIRDGRYLMGVALQFAGAAPPDVWWGDFVGNVGHEIGHPAGIPGLPAVLFSDDEWLSGDSQWAAAHALGRLVGEPIGESADPVGAARAWLMAHSDARG
jgi:hypothetical protein